MSSLQTVQTSHLKLTNLATTETSPNIRRKDNMKKQASLVTQTYMNVGKPSPERLNVCISLEELCNIKDLARATDVTIACPQFWKI